MNGSDLTGVDWDNDGVEDTIPKRWNRPILRNIYYRIYIKRTNCMIGATGPVGSGKSLLSIVIGIEFCPSFDIEKDVVYSIKDLIDRTFASVKYQNEPLSTEFFKDIDDPEMWLKKNVDNITFNIGKVIIVDEAGEAAGVRDFFSVSNKILLKTIQMWRFLRLVTIFVVPVDMRLADTTLSKFLDMEIVMHRVDRKNKESVCRTYLYRGWNKRKNQPYRQLTIGCREGGAHHIPFLPVDVVKQYETIAQTKKLLAMINHAKTFTEAEEKVDRRRSTINIEDIAKKIEETESTFRKTRAGKDAWNVPLIQTILKVPPSQIRQACALIDYKRLTGTSVRFE